MSDPQSAYALKENRDLDSVGAIVVNHARDLNVREAIHDAPGGVYVTSDPDEIRALDAYENVKRVALPPEPDPEDDGLRELTKPKLLEQPEAESIQGAKSMSVDELRAAIRAKRNEGTE